MKYVLGHYWWSFSCKIFKNTRLKLFLPISIYYILNNQIINKLIYTLCHFPWSGVKKFHMKLLFQLLLIVIAKNNLQNEPIPICFNSKDKHYTFLYSNHQITFKRTSDIKVIQSYRKLPPEMILFPSSTWVPLFLDWRFPAQHLTI